MGDETKNNGEEENLKGVSREGGGGGVPLAPNHQKRQDSDVQQSVISTNQVSKVKLSVHHTCKCTSKPTMQNTHH